MHPLTHVTMTNQFNNPQPYRWIHSTSNDTPPRGRTQTIQEKEAQSQEVKKGPRGGICGLRAAIPPARAGPDTIKSLWQEVYRNTGEKITLTQPTRQDRNRHVHPLWGEPKSVPPEFLQTRDKQPGWGDNALTESQIPLRRHAEHKNRQGLPQIAIKYFLGPSGVNWM